MLFTSAVVAAAMTIAEATRVPALASLQAMRRTTVEYAITLGYMRVQAKHLTEEDRSRLLDWLALDQQDNSDWRLPRPWWWAGRWSRV